MVETYKEKKEKAKSFWEYKVEEVTRGTEWHFFVGNSVLIRRIPYNFEVIYRKHPVSFYYGSLRSAVKHAIQCMEEQKIKNIHEIEEVLKVLGRVEKKVDEVLPDIKASIEEYKEPETIGRERKGVEKYYCTVCERNHLVNTRFGKQHIKFKQEIK